MTETYNRKNFRTLCDLLAGRDPDLKSVLSTYGYPPVWSRPASFQTLVHIILEQQVSLASARAALQKLKEKTRKITPENILALSDEELRACYFSRQKTIYVRHLAQSFLSGEIDLHKFKKMEPEEIRSILKKVKGIGDWTVDIFSMMALRHADIFPAGDLALMQSVKRVKKFSPDITQEEILRHAERWRPYSTIAAMILWHHYLERKKKQ